TGTEAGERVGRLGTEDAVGREPGVTLELEERAGGVGSEDPVLLARVETERVQATLQFGDVVAPQHRLGDVEQPVAEPEAARDECGPGLGPANPVDAQGAFLLERADLPLRGGTEASELFQRYVEADGGEATLEVADRFTAPARPQQG